MTNQLLKKNQFQGNYNYYLKKKEIILDKPSSPKFGKVTNDNTIKFISRSGLFSLVIKSFYIWKSMA